MAVTDEDGNLIDQKLMTLPFDEIEVLNDWYTLGLRGTGSNSVKMKNVFIPEHRCVSFQKYWMAILSLIIYGISLYIIQLYFLR